MYIYICMYTKESETGKTPVEKPGIKKSMKSWWLDYFSQGKLNRGNTRGKAGIEKSMKNWWFDYFSKGKLNRENTRGKARNWEIHEKLMIWLLFKRKVKQGKHPWKNQELRNPWKVEDLTTVQKGNLKEKTPVESQELRNPWKVDDLTTFQKES